MTQSSVVKKVARDMVMTYVQYLDKVTQENKPPYLDLGVDEDFKKYKELFTIVVGRVLRVTTPDLPYYPLKVQIELEQLLRDQLYKTGQSRYIENILFANLTYKVCMYVMDRIEEDKFTVIEEIQGW